MYFFLMFCLDFLTLDYIPPISHRHKDGLSHIWPQKTTKSQIVKANGRRKGGGTDTSPKGTELHSPSGVCPSFFPTTRSSPSSHCALFIQSSHFSPAPSAFLLLLHPTLPILLYPLVLVMSHRPLNPLLSSSSRPFLSVLSIFSSFLILSPSLSLLSNSTHQETTPGLAFLLPDQEPWTQN